MRLLGDWNWYSPRFLQWLPRITIEGEALGRERETVPAEAQKEHPTCGIHEVAMVPTELAQASLTFGS